MNNQSIIGNIMKSYTPRVKWAIDAVKKSGAYVGGELNKDVDKLKKDTVKNVSYMANDSIAAKVLRGKFSEVPAAAREQARRIASGETPVAWGGHTSFKGGNVPGRGQVPTTRNIIPSREDIITAKSGWPAGIKPRFDKAMLHTDVATVKALLPQIPKKYAQDFAVEIGKVLQGKPAFTQLQRKPPVVNDLLQNVGKPVMQSAGEIASKQFGQTLQSHAQNAKNMAYIQQLAKSRQTDVGLGNNMLPNLINFIQQGNKLVRR